MANTVDPDETAHEPSHLDRSIVFANLAIVVFGALNNED